MVSPVKQAMFWHSILMIGIKAIRVKSSVSRRVFLNLLTLIINVQPLEQANYYHIADTHVYTQKEENQDRFLYG